MALPKGDKMEFIVQKAVELGVSRIVPYLSKNCVSRPDKTEKKVERWRKIAAEAAKQCGRGRLPEVAAVVPVAQAIAQAAESETALFFYENERRTGLHDALAGGVRDTVSLMVGRRAASIRLKQRQPWTRDCRAFRSVHASCGVRLRRLRRLRPCSMPAATCEKK